MKTWFLILMTLAMSSAAFAEKEDHKTEHEWVYTPQQEMDFRTRVWRNKDARAGFRFQQSAWNECVDNPSGNFNGIPCAQSRQISAILQDLLADGIYECTDAALRATGQSAADDIHIVHNGILGDRDHSPRSLHAEARAIDIKSLEVKLVNGTTKKIVYEGTTNRAFYKAFRSCWGRFVKRENGCPLYQGNAEKTGSIGWEDANHQHHMHTSVPYCVGGRYGSYFYQR